MGRSGSWDSSKAFSKPDGYAAYDQIGGPRMVHAACWSHARRQFFEAVQLNPRDPVATPIVARMDELFAVDAEARRKALNFAARHIRRQKIAKPLLDEIRGKIDVAQSIALPSSALSKACQYALTLWKKLTRFLEYPELELRTSNKTSLLQQPMERLVTSLRRGVV
jgi:transposase